MTLPPFVPQPVEFRRTEGSCRIGALSDVTAEGAAQSAAIPVLETLSAAAGRPIPYVPSTGKGLLPLSLALDAAAAGGRAEGYRLTLAPGGLALAAPTPAGLARGAQTVAQALLTTRDGELPCGEILDWPRFRWRGSLLDAGRHFWSVEDTKRYIDLLALYKMNVLHWHLTEDQGWRLEIAGYPRLTEVGAWRSDKAGGRYGGFYTRDQVREVVAHAARRGIEVVPEIEMPGHSTAALAAYPELSCTGGPIEVRSGWGVAEDVYCAGNDAVFAFLEDVLRDVMTLFPSRYIHIGGDECPKKHWEQCPKCRQRLRDEGLSSVFELQKYFINRIGRFLAGHGRTLIGWDEILESSSAGVGHEVSVDFSEDRSGVTLEKSAVVQSWRGIAGAVAAARSGHEVIMSPTTHCYLDFSVERISTRQAYEYEPVPPDLAAGDAARVIGLEGNVWTARIPNRSRWDHQVFPRLCALAEVGWAPAAGRDWDEFRARLAAHETVFNRLGVEYWRDPDVWPAEPPAAPKDA